MEKNYQLLDQFLGMKVEIGVRLLKNIKLNVSFFYQSFTYYLEDKQIFLEDETNSKEAFTFFDLDEVKEIKNLYKDNLYHDVVSFKTDEYIVEVCTAAEEN